MSYSAKILADSVSQAGARLTTMEVTFPRFILAEFNTHRMLSRNSASSRAIPSVKQLRRIEEDPFIPTYWGKNQKGMQADEELSLEDQEKAIAIWNDLREYTMRRVQELIDLGVHKQIANRRLEPDMWHTVIVTATEWGNFFALRTHSDAQPEIRTIAVMMQEQYEASQPRPVKNGEWHLPLIQPDEFDGKFEFSVEARMVSAARCARVSYLTHDGKRDIDADIELYLRLVHGGHMSPLEHVATPIQYQLQPNDVGDEFAPRSEWCGNFHGWKQFRKFIPDEHDYSLARAKNE